jgi:alpha-amylase
MSNPQIRLCLVFHNHQPIGNFDGVFEAAYQDSYLPFLEVFEPYEQLKISLHTSGPLMDWLDRNHPEYLDRIAALVNYGRVEIVGGAFYEPILTMIPGRDRRGQISTYTQWLNNRLGADVQGMWVPERVWESNLTSDIADAGIKYTILDDYHFRSAGLSQEQLNGYYVTEDEGRMVSIFPGSERLRYLIPFSEPHETVDYLREIAEAQPGSVAVFGDDGEKFGTWPNTKEHVYQNGWLRGFFDQLSQNTDWLSTTTLSETVESVPPMGKIYLPDASYREMTEWALPTEKQVEHDHLVHEMENDKNWSRIQPFIRGGFWRNFKVKYPETNEMYARMMYVSQLVEKAEEEGCDSKTIEQARDWLYRGQCNCSYWHGAFGGVYLPHLRNAVYQSLIQAEKTIEQVSRSEFEWVEAVADDYNFDGRQEIRLANEQVVSWIAPHEGGQIYELDLLNIGHNLLATIQRRPESYHEKVLRGANQSNDEAASIHDRIVFKQDDLDQHLGYDLRMRKMMVDHFWDEHQSVEDVAQAKVLDRGDFADGSYQATIRRNSDRVQVMLTREGNVWGIPIKLTKAITLNSGSDNLEIAYQLEGIPEGQLLHFGVEFNFAGMPDGQEDRFFSNKSGETLGQLGETLDLKGAGMLQLTDQWLRLNVQLDIAEPTNIWAFPIRTVSQSESGFELVHQSVVVQPHWIIRGDESGRWSTQIKLGLHCLNQTEPIPNPAISAT